MKLSVLWTYYYGGGPQHGAIVGSGGVIVGGAATATPGASADVDGVGPIQRSRYIAPTRLAGVCLAALEATFRGELEAEPPPAVAVAGTFTAALLAVAGGALEVEPLPACEVRGLVAAAITIGLRGSVAADNAWPAQLDADDEVWLLALCEQEAA